MKFETLTNKKKRMIITIGIIGVIVVIGVTAFTLTRASYKQTQSVPLIKGNISYNKSDLDIVAIKLKDGSTYIDSDTVPTSGYRLNTTETVCKDKSGNKIETTFEYSNGIVNIGVTKKGTKCTLVFDKMNASEYLLAKNEMVHETFEDNEEIIDTGYRYEGKNPNNYVTFNNELWRIIGVFEVENSDTGEIEQLTKIIRSESIGDILWGTVGDASEGYWPRSDIQKILNGQYYNGDDINYQPDNWSNISISNKSINNTSRNMIENVKWDIGIIDYNSHNYGYNNNAYEFYTIERSELLTNCKYNCNNVWNGYIGLMYLSDYGLAADSKYCSRITELYNYDGDLCKNNNWFYSQDSRGSATMTSYDNNSSVFFVSNGGSIDYSDGDTSWATRPTLYLKSNVSILDNGKDGSSSKPYDLVLN